VVLSGEAILEALDDGRLGIEPEPSPRRAGGGQPSPFDTTGVGLTLGDMLGVRMPA
jgi:hypothetical protein